MAPQRKHVALVGFMGCGKSTVGPQLARALGVPFVDTDRAIEDMVGQSIPTIFERAGEAAFRAYETQALRAALACSPRIIATGGGAVVRDENWALLEQHSVPVWLRVPLPHLLDRLRSATDRPLLRDDPGFVKTQALYRTREPLYMRAPVWVDASATPMNVVQSVLERLKRSHDLDAAER